MSVAIRLASLEDAPQIAAIYAPIVLETPISFELVPPDAAEFARRMAGVLPQKPWLVHVEDGRVLGYAYAHTFRDRPAYRWTAETSVYVAVEGRRRGVASGLYAALIERLIAQGFVTAVAGITLPNEASVRLHERFGFRAVGVPRAGHKFGRWHDVGFWTRPLAEATAEPAEPRRVT
jgi:phosphinothricin acetyltransferase